MPPGKGRYTIGGKGTHGCSGYPVVGGEGKVHGCHETMGQARAQQAAIYASESSKVWAGSAFESLSKKSPCWDGYVQRGMKEKDGRMVPNCVPVAKCCPDVDMTKADQPLKEGDFVAFMTEEDGLIVGQIEHIMTEGGTYGQPGNPYSVESTPENPAVAVRLLEEDNGTYFYTPYSVGALYNDLMMIDRPNIDMSSREDDMDDDNKMSKADSYTPTSGMKAAARRALKWKEEGKATGAGTPVGWGRASDIVAGRSMSLSVVKRMYSFFSRHEVDKKGKGFYDGPEFPSNGRIMWDAWGGDAGFSWSRAIVEREAKKVWQGSAFDSSFAKKDYSTSERRRLAASGAAMPDGSFPIANERDLRNAIQSVGRASSYEAARRHIIRRARALGLTDILPDDWK